MVGTIDLIASEDNSKQEKFIIKDLFKVLRKAKPKKKKAKINIELEKKRAQMEQNLGVELQNFHKLIETDHEILFLNK